jgi:SAM-dependent methyltransferase
MTSSLFDGVAGRYAAARPTYPEAVYRALEVATGRGFGELTVLDIGAGTGIATRAMSDRGAKVTAVDPAARMLAELATAVPAARCVVGSGNALPIEDAFADLITYAQALHWTDLRRSVPEAQRVLRPQGVLAAWWNVPDFGVSWIAAQARRLTDAAPTYHNWVGVDMGPSLGEPPFTMAVENHTFRWSQDVPLDHHLATLSTHSYVAALDQPNREKLLADERAELARVFPDWTVREEYLTRLTVARQS